MELNLEKILQKARQGVMNVIASAFLFGLCNNVQAQQAEPEVKVSLRFYDSETQTKTRALRPGKTYELQVTGDNRGLNKKTVQFDIRKINISPLVDSDVLHPNPKYNANDFFREESTNEKFPMDTLNNFVRTDYSSRSTREINTSDGFVRPGPTNRFGIIASYRIVPKTDSLGHGGVIKLDRAIAYGGIGNNVSAQPTKVQHNLLFVITDGNAPVLSIRHDPEVGEGVNRILVVEGNNTRSVIEHRQALTGNLPWKTLYNNPVSGLDYELIDITDVNAPARFYRARVLQ